MQKNIIGTKVLFVNKKGSSRPIIVEDSRQQRFFVKLRHSLSNPFAGVSEFLSSVIASAIEIPTTKPHFLLLSESTDVGFVDAEVRDMIQKSFGWNICFPFLENLQEWTPDSAMPTELRHNLFLLDVLLLNIDRKHNNPNIASVNNRLLSFDYETSMLIIGGMQGREFQQNEAILRQIRQNPLYEEKIQPEKVEEMLKKLQTVDILSFAREMPEEWISSKNIENIASIFEKICHKSDAFFALLDSIANVSVESEADRKKRLAENRRKFEQGLLGKP